MKENNEDIRGFMFLNKYLDIYEYIEDPDSNELDVD